MVTDTHCATTAFSAHEAAAIVEAEWMRLEQDDELWAAEVASLLAAVPAARPSPPRLGLMTCRALTRDRGPVAPRPGVPRRRPTLRVWATQRSPPRHRPRGYSSKH